MRMDSPQRSKKKRRKEKKRRKRSSSSSSSSSNSSEWIEATLATLSKNNKTDSTPEISEERDEWMSAPLEFSGFTRDELRKKREPKEDSRKYMLDRLGQTDRELNPYWKDGGSGLPQVVKDLTVSDSAFGDHGVEWLKKALRRAKEQAADEGRRLEDVVAERWGSLEKLESMIKDAENRAEKKEKSYDKSYRDKSYDKYKYKDRENSRYKSDSDRDRDYKKSGYSKYENSSKDQRSVRKTFMKPSDDDDGDSGYRGRERKRETDHKKRYSEEYDKKTLSNKFMKPSDDDKSSYDRSRPSSSSSQSGRGWRKHPPPKDTKGKEEESKNEDDKVEFKPNKNIENKREETVSSPVPVYLSADERNELAAKLVKAEILGNTELVNKLKSRLEQARSAAADAENTVVLTRTDSKGFTQPLSLAAEPEHSRRRKEKTQTHESGKRVRYFADDDKYSLKEMFEREKRSTVEDQNEMFARLASKNVGRDESANDMDDVFEEMVRVKESDGKTAARERNRAIDEHRRSVQALDNCQWCLDGKRLLKHLVITIGSKVYLCVPPYESLTTGHCLLIPNQHAPCSTQLDEEVWEEITVFRKALVKMFLSKDMDVIFFESAMSFARMPHMMWHCVPVPKESGDLAPIYFKKAILECETEWAINKKLVELSQKSLRRAIPRGLPYFAVDFGLQPGFAHVIEDEKAFPNHFAQEIIGGMLDSDICLWRKPRLQKFNEQREKVMEFITWWKPFNCIKKEKT